MYILLNRVFEGFETIRADELALEICYVACVVAEDAGRLILLEDDLVLVNEDIDCVAVLDVHCVSDLDREYYSAEFVDLSYDTSRFHFYFLRKNITFDK